MVVDLGLLPRSPSPLLGEKQLRMRLAHLAAGDIVVIDAPLTLPPALRDRGRELDQPDGSAWVRRMWAEGWHPVTARECEFALAASGGPRPGATMRLGMIAARAIVLARELRARGVVVLETYPRAVRHWMREHTDATGWGGGYAGLAGALRESGLLVVGERFDLDDAAPDALDALLCVIVGAAYLRGSTVPPPVDLDEIHDGWIRVPTAGGLDPWKAVSAIRPGAVEGGMRSADVC